ncbi:hypothetical protein Ccrd_022053 [Cynara cardunculus var. scolymus]|uniref:Leucine-rich repeat, cysteine-containing subtype n=1 Tax=Cynara cardunculus var. scolymus TaxID=59895 RepID=A0A124SEC9_CYNCS|nr:hypothetical protein Ccrd_022053 [Cynara cardunculus var. scolymus]
MKFILQVRYCGVVQERIFRGWVPTFPGYSAQGACKFGCYEFFGPKKIMGTYLARWLRTLLIRWCDISDSMVEQVAKKLSRVTHMDLSYCCNIRSRGSTAIGKNCKGLVTLQRNMHPQDVCPQDEDAAAIAANMSKFKHLQMIFNCKRTKSVKKIIESWPDLEELDMRACWDVALSPLAREVCSQG